MARVITNIEGAESVLKDVFNSELPRGRRKAKVLRMLKVANELAAQHHRATRVPMKFKQPAASQYNMQKRKPRTMKRKRGFAKVSGVNSRIYHIWRGQTMRNMTSRRGRIKSKQSEDGIITSITYTVPFYIVKNKHNVPMFDELTRLNRADRETWADLTFSVVASML